MARKWPSLEEVTDALMLGAFVSAVGSAIAAYPVMLALGVIHHDITRHCPPLGFLAVFVLCWALDMLAVIAGMRRRK